MYYGPIVGQVCLQASTNVYLFCSWHLPIYYDGPVGDLEHVLVYIDDIMIVQKIGELQADHMKKIKQV